VARLAYLGSPDAAVAPLLALQAAGHDITLVVSRADTRRGRGTQMSPSPVKAAALDLGLAVSDSLDDVLASGAELAVVAAYGRIIPARILDVVPMINIHFSLLPRWRGAAPVERAILAGDDRTGVCIMRLDVGLDTGPVLAVRDVRIGADEHASALVTRLSLLGATLLVDVLAAGVDALGPGTAQVGEPTYAAKLDPAEFAIDWSAPATVVHRLVRLDRAWTTFRGERLRILDARPIEDQAPAAPDGPDGPDVGDGGPGALTSGNAAVVVAGAPGQPELVELLSVQPAGKRPMSAADWRRGVRAEAGEILGDEDPATGDATPVVSA
jgi:methionyl-tRNA formyltransferase